MTTTHDRLRLAVLEPTDETGEVGGTLQDETAHSVATVDPDDGLGDPPEADCLLVDQGAAPDRWRAILADATDRGRQLAVVVLVATEFQATVSTAIEAGADGYLPRSVCLDRPTLAASRVETVVSRTRAASDAGDGLDGTHRSLFESISDGLVVHEPESGEILDVNEQYCSLTGYDRSELIGSRIRIIVPEESEYSYETALRHIENAREDGPQLFEFEGEHKNGERFHAEVHLQTVRFGGAERVLASVRDVTGRKRREDAIRELQTATERIQQAATRERVVEIVVETAADALGLPAACCWFQEDSPERLTPVAATDPIHERGLFAPVPVDAFEYEAFEAGEITTYEPRRVHPEVDFETAVLLPLGDHGLVAAGRSNSRTYDEVTLDVARTLAEHATTALDRIAREGELRESQQRLEAIVDRIDEAIFLAPVSELPKAQPAPDFVSSGYEAIWGQPLDGIQKRYDEGFFGTLHPEDYDDYRAQIDRIVDDVEAGVADDRYSREYRIERPDGTVRWVHSDFYPTDWRDGEPQVVIVSRDVTARKERERTVESFQDASAGLTTAETVTEAARIAVDAAADVFDLPATAVYHYDDSTRLDPTATGPAVPDANDLPVLTADDARAWESFVDETMYSVAVQETAALDVGSWPEALLLPLGGNGLLVVWRTAGEFDTEAASILAATLEAALNRLRGERRLETRREELETQTERARRLEAITEVTRRVEAAITTESTRSGVFEAVCSELVEVDPFTGAWIAGAEVGTDRLTPRAVAGVDRDHVDRVLGGETTSDADRHPATDAWQSGSPRVVGSLVGGGRRSEWRQHLLKAGLSSVCAVPLAHGGVTYGVLVVAADESDAFDERVVDVLSQLGHSIGHATTAIERQRALESDDTVELAFRGPDMDLPIARLAREAECQVHHERTVRRQDGTVSVFYSLRDGEPADLDALATETLPGDVEVVADGSERAVLERRGSSWFGAVVSEYGGVLRHGEATPERVELVVELPRETDTRAIVERLQAEYPALELTAQRHHRETDTRPGDVQDRVERQLTDRQYEAIVTAHAMGYFDWPRESSGEAVAESLDITQPTVNKHIRLGERKILDLLFGSADTDAS